MKISHTERVISPEIGACLAGYGSHDVSVAKYDDLYLSALALDDGKKKAVILGYDLLGIQDEWIRLIRTKVAEIFGGTQADCILSCTHTHTGPHSRILPRAPESFREDYMHNLLEITLDAVRELFSKEFIETDVSFFSGSCDQNLNRRYVGPENRCSFLPRRRDLEPIADGICDKEMGGLCFRRKDDTEYLEYVIGNFSAHPLAGHSLGIGARRISADFPGAFRRYIKRETGAGCMYLSGAAGDTVPRGHETGTAAIEEVGKKLGTSAISSMLNSRRIPANYKLTNETIQTGIKTSTYRVRPHMKKDLTGELVGKDTVELEVQLLSIGDVCLIGVPGEMVNELGLEMKWHSPFRKTFVLYCSTSYISYICHGNALVSGGYEADCQIPDSRAGLQLVNTAIDCAYELYELTFPDPAQWPQNNRACNVSIANIDAVSK